jgi:hypothetical protein
LGRKIAFALAVLLVACVTSVALGQDKKKGESPTRSVQGVVTSADDTPASMAVVYLKNLKTLLITSFITKENGTYYFHGLSPDIDYELRAAAKDQASPTKTLSAFDSRTEATINLKMSKKPASPAGR